MKIEELFEVRILGNIEIDALKDNHTIRVYHGTSDLETVIVALTKGLTGGSRVARKYSYENNNNPRGLFVTPDLRTAKDFGPYILEFHSKVRDLEAPVWPGGTFTVQGGMSGVWKDEDERTLAMLAQRNRLKDSEVEYIRDSDRPDVAYWLLDVGERQALFTGNLNANGIRAIWMSNDPSRINQPFTRMSPRDFLKIVRTEGAPNQFGGRFGEKDVAGDMTRDARRKMFTPREEPTLEEYLDRLQSKHNMPRKELIDILKKAPEEFRPHFWSDRQFDRVMRELR